MRTLPSRRRQNCFQNRIENDIDFWIVFANVLIVCWTPQGCQKAANMLYVVYVFAPTTPAEKHFVFKRFWMPRDASWHQEWNLGDAQDPKRLPTGTQISQNRSSRVLWNQNIIIQQIGCKEKGGRGVYAKLPKYTNNMLVGA